MNPIQEFKDSMLNHGVTPPDSVIADGKLHRFKINGKLNGAYVLHLDGKAAGYFEDFKQGIKVKWKSNATCPKMTPEDRKAFAIQCQEEEAKRQAELTANRVAAALKAVSIWQQAPLATQDHPYLIRKGIKPHGARLGRGNTLIIPLFNSNRQLVNLQFIQPEKPTDGSSDKRFLTGGQKKACYWRIGNTVTDKILICEGFATAASCHEATGYLTVIAFDAGNLTPVAEVIRAKMPKVELIIMADNDKSCKGQSEARKAAIAANGKYLVCPVAGQDFNDYLKGV